MPPQVYPFAPVGYRAVSTASGVDLKYDGAIYGIVRKGAVPVAGAEVHLHHRGSSVILALTYSGSDGRFTFADLETVDKYHVFAYDPNTGAPLNVARRAEVAPTTKRNVTVYPVGVMATAIARPNTFIPSALYWRIRGITLGAGASYLEISELQVLQDGVNITSSATKTASTNPDVLGTLADLYDGSTATRPIWNAATATNASFWLKFVFATAKTLNGFKQAGYDTSSRYIAGFTMQYSSDNVNWLDFATKSGLTYPGNNTLSPLITLP